MKRLLAVASIVVGMSTPAFAQGVEKTLLDLEQQWIAGSLASKPDAVAPLLHTNFVLLQSDGVPGTKTQYLAQIKAAKWQVSALSDMKAQVFGDTAIVSGMWTGKGIDPAGKKFDGRERFVDTWMKQADGKWLCVSSASTPTK